MPLSWNEIKSRALTFSRTWADAANENSQAKPFWIDFFEIFGVTNKRVATFEHAVKKLPGLNGGRAKTDGFIDLFWPGMLLVEQKSRGKNLDAALTQALSYFPGIAERDLPQIVIVCDFARFRVHRLATNETIEFTLKDLHKHVKLFGFVAGYKVQTIQPQNPVNIKAAERMGRLHDALNTRLPPQALRTLPLVLRRVQRVQAMRAQSAKAATRRKGATPTLFTEDRQPRSGRYLAVPCTSSENRRYLPLGYLEANVIAANDLQIVPNATLFHFGILASAMHRA